MTDKVIGTTKTSTGETIDLYEEILRHRFRNRAGIQINLGNIFPMGKTFALEIYYGLGVRVIYSNRFDVARGMTLSDKQYILEDLNFKSEKFYFRPTIHAGVKLRIGW